MSAPAAAANFVKAKLIIDGGTTLDCYFNPTEYSLTKSNEWTAQYEERNNKGNDPL